MVGKCAICGRGAVLHCDHNHETGFVRGWLCNGCNLALGLLADNPVIADAAAAYLRKPDTETTYRQIRAARARQWRADNPGLDKANRRRGHLRREERRAAERLLRKRA
jgi:hypothetical protein